MPEATRTARQWHATARRVRNADPALAGRIRAALAARAYTHPDDPLTVELSGAEAAALERLAPMGGWWMPAAPGGAAPADEGRRAAEAADALVRGHRRGRPGR
jgi:hypothetical protein